MHSEDLEERATPESEAQATGVVYRKSLGHYGIETDGGTVSCTLSSRLRKQLVYPLADPASRHHRVVAVEEIGEVDPVALGDRVQYTRAPDGTGVITGVLPRRSALTRRAAGRKPLAQVIVANVDLVVAVVAVAQPAPKWALLDRYLCAAEAQSLPALICLTKLDLGGPGDLQAEVATYRALGYAVVLTSAQSGLGLGELRAALAGRVSVLVGKSGVGKSSLLNALEPGLGLRVAAVSAATQKGRHTTSRLELFALEGSGAVVDTPGTREFGLWDLPLEELAQTFPELRPHLGRCRFGASCTHVQEPGCAIRAAVAGGQVSARRYASYLRLREE